MEIKNYKKLIAENIKLDWLLEVANRNGKSEVAMVHEIKLIDRSENQQLL